MNRVSSSDGVGSSRSSSILSEVSSNFQEAQPYKPEFLKYLESSFNFLQMRVFHLTKFELPIDRTKLDHSAETGEQLKPEDDILYQWRLRRRLEEAKKTNSETQSTSCKTLSPTEANKQLEDKNFQNTNITTITTARHTIETQTSTAFDTFESNKKHISTETQIEREEDLIEDDYCDNEVEIENEEPTRDTSNYLDVALIVESQPDKKLSKEKSHKIPISVESMSEADLEKKSHKTTSKSKNNFLSSSPIKEKARHSVESNVFASVNSKGINNSADFTRVSSISDTPNVKAKPRTSTSPTNIRQAKVDKGFNAAALTNSSSISSTLTNYTTSRSINESLTNTAPNKKSNSNNKKQSIYSTDENISSEKELIESDEILRILFKKNYFYQLKLK